MVVVEEEANNGLMTLNLGITEYCSNRTGFCSSEFQA
jgi:hypothetical protein